MNNFFRNCLKGKKVIILALFFVLITSGCSLNFGKSKEVVDWEDEVLMAQGCGIEGLSCCLDNDSPCEVGTVCCFDPNNTENHKCVVDCTCGIKDSYCCEKNTCGDNLACSNGQCVDCGEAGESCCGDSVCNESLLCYQDTCVTCGNPDTPCCDGDEKCLVSEGDESRIECLADICRVCGSGGKQLCATEPFCDTGFFVSNSLCLQCGGFNQPCCIITDEIDYDCDVEKNLSCVYGFCIEE